MIQSILTLHTTFRSIMSAGKVTEPYLLDKYSIELC